MKNKVNLKGKLVRLRPLSVKDAPKLCQWLNDIELSSLIDNHEPTTVARERKWIRENMNKRNNLRLSIETIDGTFIGIASLKNIDQFNRNAEFGIFIGDKKYWGQGCGTEAGRLIIDYGFTKLRLHSIYLRYIAFNIRGEKSYRKLGFKPAGYFRQAMLLRGAYHDQKLMDLLREEWLKIKMSKFKNQKFKSNVKSR